MEKQKNITVSGLTIAKSGYVMLILMALFGALGILMLLLVNDMRNQQHQDHLFMGAIEDVQIHTSLFHLWLEEYIAGDRNKDQEEVFSYLDSAEKEIQIMLYGGITSHGRLSNPVRDYIAVEAVNNLQVDIDILRKSSLVRLDRLNKSGIGTALDQAFDRAFYKFIKDAGKLEDLWIKNDEEYMYRSRSIIRLTIIAWFLALGFSIVGLTLLERKRSRAERDTVQSEEKFKHVISTANDAIITIDQSGIIKQWNTAATDIFGYTEDEMIDGPVSRIMPERYRKAHNAGLEHYVENGRGKLTYPATFEGLKKDGTEIPIELTVAAWVVNGGHCFTSFLRDITERKNAEGLLKDSEKRYRELYENSPLGYQSLDINGCFVESNPTLCWMLGCSRENVIGKWFGDFLTYESREKFKKNFPLFKAKGQVYGVPFEMLRCDGSTFTVEIDGRIGHDEKGDFKQTHCIITDVTKRKKTEDKLKESEERFRSIFNMATDGFYVIDLKGRYMNVNDAGCKLFGYTREEFLSSDLRMLFFPEDMKDVYDKYSTLWLEGGFVSDMRLRNKDETEVYVDINITPLQIGGENFALGIVRDVTERRRTDTELKKLDKLQSIGIMADGIAHDYNNIMAAISVNVGLAMTYLDPTQEPYDILKAAEKSALSGSALSAQLRTFAGGGTTVKKTVLNLLELIKDRAKFSLSGSNTLLELRLADNLWPVEADDGQLRQVIQNLVINGSKAMPGGGTLTISAENIEVAQGDILQLKEGRYIKVSVIDNGVGIPDDIKDKVFDPYYTTRGLGSEKGTGLGLGIVHSIIKEHGGYVYFDSKAGEGTTFYFYLPASNKVPIAIEEQTQSHIPSDNTRVLILEDDEQVYYYLPKLLDKLGYEATVATGGAETIKLYKEAMVNKRPFDAVLVDLVIRGGIGGKEVMVELLKIDPNIKAMVSSGLIEDLAVIEYEKYGFKGTLNKPYTSDNLKTALHKLLCGDA